MGNVTEAFAEKLKTDWRAFLLWLNLAKIISIVLVVIALVLVLIFRSCISSMYNDGINKFKSTLDTLDDINTIGFAFWFAITLLIVISIIKHFMINTESLKKDFGEFVMELPIDICNIVITILASLYLSQHTGKGITLIFLTVGIVTICAVFRRLSIKKGGFEHFSLVSAIFGLADIVVAMFWINFVLELIKH